MKRLVWLGTWGTTLALCISCARRRGKGHVTVADSEATDSRPPVPVCKASASKSFEGKPRVLEKRTLQAQKSPQSTGETREKHLKDWKPGFAESPQPLGHRRVLLSENVWRTWRAREGSTRELSTEDLIVQLANEGQPSESRRKVLRALAHRDLTEHGSRILDALCSAAASGSTDLRWYAFYELAEMARCPVRSDWFDNHLNEHRACIAEIARNALGSAGTDECVRVGAARLAARAGLKELILDLRELVRSPEASSVLQMEATLGLAELGDEVPIASLGDIISSKNAPLRTRTRAVEALAAQGAKGLDALERLAAQGPKRFHDTETKVLNPDSYVALMADNFARNLSLKVVLQTLHSRETEAEKAAALTKVAFGSQSEGYARVYALQMLARIGSEEQQRAEAARALARTAADISVRRGLRMQALNGLGIEGCGGKECLPQLEELANDSDLQLRMCAEEAEHAIRRRELEALVVENKRGACGVIQTYALDRTARRSLRTAALLVLACEYPDSLPRVLQDISPSLIQIVSKPDGLKELRDLLLRLESGEERPNVLGEDDSVIQKYAALAAEVWWQPRIRRAPPGRQNRIQSEEVP